ncbi:MAG: hypothetical protein AVDCRST_MAG39-1777 [uncultured Sphingomonadaceae bacterium]|uniref:Uncharacterized protein n=1 Tax=uncultured Sphingomonadaceae bacterium TaxID=169976 RepID=A0A6J4SX33_9SPHN|nr:MAG: hypothetical protein AVDCRST_MAG39-1777 [uncultured Sphingomonadaceae bacterium]
MIKEPGTETHGEQPFAAPDRGKAARSGSGEVRGSGAGTGGGNPGEDYDQDSAASSGSDPLTDAQASESRENTADKFSGQYDQ